MSSQRLRALAPRHLTRLCVLALAISAPLVASPVAIPERAIAPIDTAPTREDAPGAVSDAPETAPDGGIASALDGVDLTDPEALGRLAELFPRRLDSDDGASPAAHPPSARRAASEDPSIPKSVLAYVIMERPSKIPLPPRPAAILPTTVPPTPRPIPPTPRPAAVVPPAAVPPPPAAAVAVPSGPPQALQQSAPQAFTGSAPQAGLAAAPKAAVAPSAPPPAPTPRPAPPPPAPIAPPPPPPAPVVPPARAAPKPAAWVPPPKAAYQAKWSDSLHERTVIERITNVNITFYDCASQSFCGTMYNGTQVFEGAAACSWNLEEGTRFVILGDPEKRLYVCEDRGLLDDTWVDIFFYQPADGWQWAAATGRYGSILIVE